MNNLNYFNTGDKSLCSGCSACQQACPFEALSMRPDEEGFIFPVKDLNKCTECGLCERVCPFPKPNYPESENIAYGCYVKDVEERKKSSSGALFAIIAQSVIKSGGIVYGACLSSDLKVFHKGVSHIEGLNDIRGSKYVQSDIRNTYRDIKNHLINGEKVYFCGTGCQVAGLKAFLRKNYASLITSDLVCHGVPPQKLFDEHIKYLNKEYGQVIDYSFRNNKQWGVNEYVTTADGIIHERNSFILSPYLNSFIKGMTFRYSCYNCPYAHIPRQGDITLADLWGAKKLSPSLDPKHGISFVLLNSKKGKEIWEEIQDKIEYVSVDINKVIDWNQNLAYTSKIPQIRTSIFQIINEKGYPYVAKTIFRASNKEIAMVYLKRYVKLIIKFLKLSSL